MTNIKEGIELRSGKVVLRKRSFDDYSDSVSDDDSSEGEYLLTTFWGDLPKEIVTEYVEKKVSSEIEVPNGFGEVVGEYLEELNRSYQDCKIDHNQLHELVKGFDKYLSWFPNNVPEKKIKKFCREAYGHVLWKAFSDEKISRRQFVSLMGRRPKFFRKKS